MKRFTRARADEPEQEYVITTAPTSHAEDIGRRRRTYVISMAIRLVCFVLLFFVPRGWPMVLVAVGAVVIPYVAVIGANSGGELVKQTPMAEYIGPELSSPAPAEAQTAETPTAETVSADEPDEDVIILEPLDEPSTGTAHSTSTGPAHSTSTGPAR